jgi:hypothetical protein
MATVMAKPAGFGHGIDSPKSNLAVLEANRDWFQHYIWNEPIPDDSALHGTSESDVAPPQAGPNPAGANCPRHSAAR